jgi:pilus assembly protein FimV
MATTGAILAFLTVMPGLAWALGLGQIQSDTHIGQPLKARIPILVDNANDLQGLKVDLAEPSAYQQAGLRESDYLYTLDFQVKHGSQGPYVLVTSSQPVKLPFINLLVRARWTSGQVTRQYTLLLNPPVFASKGQHGGGAQTQPAVSEPSTTQRSQHTSARQNTARTNRPEAASAQPETSPVRNRALQAHSYGPVQHGDTLWGIANRLHAGTGLSVNQMMVAIYRANPQAFSGNINRLKSGIELHVPSQADVSNISRHAATSEVADQNRSWQSAKAPAGNETIGNEEVAEQPSNGSVSGQKQPAPQGHGDSTEKRNAVGEHENTDKNTGETADAGEVVLTAPTVAESSAGASADEKTAANVMAGSTATATAAGAAVAAGGAQEGKSSNEQGKPDSSDPVAAASSGGPLKSHNAELAALAGQGDETANKSGQEKTATKTPIDHEAAGSQPANTLNTSAGTSTVMDWLTSPKGWIVIVLIVILLILIAYFLIRRRHEQAHVTAAERANAESREHDEARHPDEATAAFVAGGAHEDYPDDEDADTLTAQTDEEPVVETAEAQASDEADTDDEGDQALADALVEADFYAGSGDHAGAAASLAVALVHAPERNDLRLRRLEELHAAGERDAFLAEAEVLHGQVPEDSADWQAVAVMGRQLLPAEALFREEGEAAPSATEAREDEEASLDVDRELDRLTNTESSRGFQDEFEHTLGELSTMIETYMPEDGAVPDELQSSFKENAPETPSFTLENETQSALEEDDEPLEFEPQAMLSEQTPEAEGPAIETEDEPVDAEVLDLEETAQTPVSEETSIDLELARSYLDMGDTQTARGVLEDVLTDGDPASRDQALQLLDNLDSVGEASTAQGFADEPDDAKATMPYVATEADGEADAEHTPQESGTMLDLARAYIEMDDRESARDVLEEVLDKGDAGETEQARELLDTL